MIKKLIIKNYALIDELEIDFGSGLSIITGETGAGKSIMLGALGLLRGDRADTRVIADKTRKTVIEATFEIPDSSDNQPTGNRQSENQHSDGQAEELIVRREIQPSGRSRAFIDDSPVTLAQLGDVTSRLLDIHSQHANLSLTTREGQRMIIDAMAGNEELLSDYRETFRRYVDIRSRIRKMKEEAARNKEKRESIIQKLEFLKKLNVKRGEQKAVERQFELLSDADEIREHLSAANYLLSESEDSVLNAISASIAHLQDVENILEDISEEDETLSSRLKNIAIEIKDIAETADRQAARIESNPALLAKAASRMKEIYEAVRTFHASGGDELADIREKLEKELSEIDGEGDKTEKLEQEARREAHLLKEKAAVISQRRREASEDFCRILMDRVRPLGLANLRFEVRMEPTKLTTDGGETIEFVTSFNKNGELLPMAMTASGGELSRLTLGIKSIMAEKMEMPTVIFDEVDTGVSGEIASKMGAMMTDMAEKIQILSITHLPQVAAKGERHYKVRKSDTADRTISTIVELTPEERVREIAAMMSGEKITEAALSAARELIGK